MTNRRKSTRISQVTMARITPQELQTAAMALVRDISVGGIGVYVKGRYQKGDILLIKVSFVTDEGETIMESLKGRVAWLKPLEGETQYAVGVQIPDMEHRHPKLHAYLLYLEDH